MVANVDEVRIDLLPLHKTLTRLDAPHEGDDAMSFGANGCVYVSSSPFRNRPPARVSLRGPLEHTRRSPTAL
jgi:hypothetical protein